MSEKNEIKFDVAVLDGLVKQLSKESYVKVGILAGANPRTGDDGISNVEIGVVQELGSFTHNIPPRSFLRMPLQQKSPDIVKFAGSKKIMDLMLAGRQKGALALLGVYAEAIVQSAFASRGFGQWAPNAPATIKRKGSDRPLVDTSQLRRSISSEAVIG